MPPRAVFGTNYTTPLVQPWPARHDPLAGSSARQPARRLAGTTARQPTAARLQPIARRHRCAASRIASLHTLRLDRLLHGFAVGIVEYFIHSHLTLYPLNSMGDPLTCSLTLSPACRYCRCSLTLFITSNRAAGRGRARRSENGKNEGRGEPGVGGGSER